MPIKMRFARLYLVVACLSLTGLLATNVVSQATAIKSIEITGGKTEFEVGQQAKFTAVAKDDTGRAVNEKPALWFAAPFDLAAADENGTVSFYQPGEVTIGVLIGGKTQFTKVIVKPAPIKTILIDPVPAPLVVGGTLRLIASARIFNGDPRTDVAISWASDNPAIATVDPAGVVTGIGQGKATLRAASGVVSGTTTVNVIKNPVKGLIVEPASTTTRTGDVIHFKAVPSGTSEQFGPRW